MPLYILCSRCKRVPVPPDDPTKPCEECQKRMDAAEKRRAEHDEAALEHFTWKPHSWQILKRRKKHHQ